MLSLKPLQVRCLQPCHGTLLLSRPTTSLPYAAAPSLDDACQELLLGGGFAGGCAWTINRSEVPDGYVTFPAAECPRAVSQGIVEAPSQDPFSSFHQQATIPALAQHTVHLFFAYPIGDDSSGDERLLALLDPLRGDRAAKHWRTPSSAQVPTARVIDLY